MTEQEGQPPLGLTRTEPSSSAHQRFRFPMTLFVYLLVCGLGLWTAGNPVRHSRLREEFGLNWQDLTSGRVYRLVTSVFVQSAPGIRATIAALLIVFPIAEWRLGTRKSTAILFIGDWASTIMVLVATRIAASAGIAGAMTATMTRDGGTSSAAHALASAVCATVHDLRLRRLLVCVIGGEIAISTALGPHLFDAQHALSAVSGWLLVRSTVQKTMSCTPMVRSERIELGVLIHNRDGGASSGTIGIVVALLASVRDRRPRAIGRKPR